MSHSPFVLSKYLRRLRWQRWLTAFLALLAVAAVIVLFWAHRVRQAELRVGEAEMLLREGRVEEALALAAEAVGGRRTAERARWVRLEAYRAMGSRAELDEANALWGLAGTSDALLRLVQAAMRWNRQAEAFAALEEARKSASVSEVNRLALEATAAAHWGDYPKAARVLEKAIVMGYPENDQTRLTMGILLVAEGDHEEGLSRLEEITPDSPYFAEAIRNRVEVYRQLGRVEAIEEVSEALFTDPHITVSEKLLTLDFLYDQGRTAWVYMALDWMWHTGQNAAQISDLLLWAYLEDRAVEWADEALASLPAVAFEDLPLRVVGVARNHQKKRFLPQDAGTEQVETEKGAEGAGDGQHSPVDFGALSLSSYEGPFVLLLRLGRLQEEGTGRSGVALRVLERELHSVLVASPEQITPLDRFVRAFGMDRSWEAVLTRLSRESKKIAEPALFALHRIYAANRDTPALYRLMERAVELNPDDLVALNNVVYIGLLLEVDSPQFERLVERIGEHQQRDIRFASTYAHALLLRGRAMEALELLESYPPEVLASPSVALSHSAILEAVGRSVDAQHALSHVDAEKLFPEEEVIFERIRDRVGRE
jgi:tetratricopeptide (TPR) repeat protein